MKKYLIVLILLLVPCTYALKTGVIVDVQGDIHKGCVNINNGDSAYDVLKAFDKQDDNIEMKFDGNPLQGYYLRSINGLSHKTEGDKSYGWNFFVTNSDNDDFTEPPELSPGWGMGIADYKITEEETIGIIYSYTIYNLDWSIKKKPEKPSFIKYSELCEKLSIKDITIKVNGKKEKSADEDGGTIDIYPGSKLEIEVEIENLYPDDIKLEDVYIEASIEDIDDGDDLDKETDDKDISAGKDKTFKLDFDIPLYLDSDDYELTLDIFSEDELGLEHNKRITYDIEIDREKHDIVITNIGLFPESLSCRDTFAITLDFLNIGKEDEDIELTISGDELNIHKEDSFSIDEEERESRSYNFKVGEIEPGEYPISIQAGYSNKNLDESVNIIKTACEGPSSTKNKKSQTQDKEASSDTKGSIEIITARAVQDTPPIKSQEKNIMPYIVLGVFIIGIIVAIVLLALLMKPKKK